MVCAGMLCSTGYYLTAAATLMLAYLRYAQPHLTEPGMLLCAWGALRAAPLGADLDRPSRPRPHDIA